MPFLVCYRKETPEELDAEGFPILAPAEDEPEEFGSLDDALYRTRAIVLRQDAGPMRHNVMIKDASTGQIVRDVKAVIEDAMEKGGPI